MDPVQHPGVAEASDSLHEMHSGRVVVVFLRSLLYQFDYKPGVLRAMQRHLPEDVRQDPDVQVAQPEPGGDDSWGLQLALVRELVVGPPLGSVPK